MAENHKSADLIALETNSLYKDFIVFYPNRQPPYDFADLSSPVTKLRLVSTGHQDGHWILCFWHDAHGHKRTYINCKAVVNFKNDYSQVWVGALDLQVEYGYDLAVEEPHKPLREYIHVLLHPSASAADGVHEDKPMLWYQYHLEMGAKTAGCRHWTESVARAFARNGGLLRDTEAQANVIIANGGAEIELKNLKNPKGRFSVKRPEEKDYKIPAVRDHSDSE
ncbi:hypothetical protein B0H19DRAFT_574768 [Mycena capillaripes]|nr:hypothetical protein B0H19DRAFT_574768 [Mycena capillaripes]